MFLGLGQGRDRDQNFSTCWNLLQFGFKFYFLLQVILGLLSYFLGGTFLYFPNIISQTVQKFELWRLASSILFPAAGNFAFINVLFNFYLLYMFMPDFEKRLSTAYILIQVLLQTFLCNIVLTIVAYPFIYYQILSDQTLVGYGVVPILFCFLWRKVALNPQQPTRFCFLPCLIPMKYIPLCLLTLYLVFKYPPVPLIVYCLLGFYQSMVRNKAILRLPLSVYRKIDTLMPLSIRDKLGYIKVSTVQSDLKKVCLEKGCCEWRSEEAQTESNSFNEKRQNAMGQKQRVEVIGNGVEIGGSTFTHPKNQNDFRKYWKDKDQEEIAENTIKNIGNVTQNQQILQSDQSFTPNYNLKDLNSSSKALNREIETETDNKTEFSEIGLRSGGRQFAENDQK